MEKETWIVVANSSQARIFKLHNLVLEEQDAFVHPESRLHEGDLVSDAPGRTFDRVGVGRHGLDQKNPPKKNEAVTFAKQIADHLDKSRAIGVVNRFFIAASPSFLGVLRQEMSQPMMNLIDSTVDKDITQMKAEEIITYFPIGL